MPRPTKRTPEVVKAIIDALAAGSTRKAACQYVGVSEDAFGVWMKRFADFADSVLRAEGGAEIAATAAIAKAVRAGDVRACIFWLERRRPRDWGRHDYLEIEVRQTAERVARETGADPAWLIQRAGEIAAAAERLEP